MDEKCKSELQKNGADLKSALRSFMGKEEMYEKYLVKFLKEDPNYDNLMSSLENKKYPEAFRCAHTLKGVSINLGLVPLYESVSDLTEELRGKEPEEVDLAAVDKIKEKVVNTYHIFADIIENGIRQQNA